MSAVMSLRVPYNAGNFLTRKRLLASKGGPYSMVFVSRLHVAYDPILSPKGINRHQALVSIYKV